MYSEARNDAKLRTLSAEQFRVWFNLMCFAGEQDNRGRIACDDMDILAVEVADADGELLAATLGRLAKLRIVSQDESAIVFLHWDERQYDRPSDRPEEAAARKRAQREREKAARDDAPSSICVTPESRDVTPSHATYTEAEADPDPDPEIDHSTVLLNSDVGSGSASADVPAAQELIQALQGLRGWPEMATPKLCAKVEGWRKRYGTLDIMGQIDRMDSWLMEPKNKRSRASPLFVDRWFERAASNAQRNGASNANNGRRNGAHPSDSDAHREVRPDRKLDRSNPYNAVVVGEL